MMTLRRLFLYSMMKLEKASNHEKQYAKYTVLQKYTVGIYLIRKKVYQGEYVIDFKLNGIRLLDK